MLSTPKDIHNLAILLRSPPFINIHGKNQLARLNSFLVARKGISKRSKIQAQENSGKGSGEIKTVGFFLGMHADGFEGIEFSDLSGIIPKTLK